MGIVNYKNDITSKTYLSVAVLGNSLKLNVKYKNINTIELDKTTTEINLILPKKYKNMENMEIINLAIKKLYSKIAETEIEYSMEIARHILGFAPDDYSIKMLDKDYYKCYKKQLIISPDIVRFNRKIINTTIIEAFCKTRYKQGSIKYKKLLSNAINEYEIYNNKETSNFKLLKIS